MRCEIPVMAFAVPITPYQPHFALLPVITWDGRFRWLCWVERRMLAKKAWLDGPIGRPWAQFRVFGGP